VFQDRANFQRREDARCPVVQADGWLVENVENAAQLRSNLRGEADALAFAARKCGGGAAQLQ